MIIQLRGTSGSGKSTIVRKVMGHYPTTPYYKQDRKQPIGYLGVREDGRSLWVVGHYETACGGCDTIASLDEVYDEIRKADTKGYNVLYEGIMASGEYRRCADLYKEKRDIRVIALDVPIALCLDGVQERRRARKNDKPLDPSRTVRRAREVRSMMEHLKVCRVPSQWASRETALALCIELLGVKA